MKIGNSLVRAVLLLVLCGGILAPAVAFSSRSTSSDPTSITKYDADFTVSKDGDLRAVETLTVDFPAGVSKHGIFRFFDTHDPSAPHARRIPHDITVTQDGGPAQTELSWKNGRRYRMVRIGDPDHYVAPGAHVYRISYRIDGVLEKGDDSPTQLFWSLIPSGWAQDIGAADLRVHLPVAPEHPVCTVSDGSACTMTIFADNVRVQANNIPRNTSVTLRTGLDLPTPAAGKTLPWTGRWDGVLGRSVVGVVIVVLLAIAAAAAGLIGSRRTKEADPGFPLQYAPPEGIGPAQAQYVRKETAGREVYVASIMEAADKGAVTLSHEGAGWTITDTGAGWQGVDDVTAKVYDLIGSPKGAFTATKKDVSAGERLKSEMSSFDAEVKKWALRTGYLVRSGSSLLRGLVVVGVLAAGAVIFWNPFSMSLAAAVPGLFAILGGGMVATGASTRRTPKGRDLWSRVEGFHRILSTESAEARFDFASRKDLYVTYLPWAVAFGCADAWARKYQTEMGTPPPTPSYFGTYAGASLGSSVNSMVDSFSSTVDSAISSYEATQSSSSSGGGGGGGGGGGSW